MSKIRLSALALAGLVVPFTCSAQFADSVVSYTPGTGISTAYTDPSHALGGPTVYNGYQDTDPFNPPYLATNLVGLGAGGSLTVAFSTPIQHDAAHPFGLDFIIFGHAGFNLIDFNAGTTDGSLFTGGTSTARVSVSADGTTFYTLNSALAPKVDGLFPTDAAGDPLTPVNPALNSSDFAGKDLAGIRSLYAGSGGGAGFSLAWAQDGAGQSLLLPSVRFVRIDLLSGTAYIDALSVVPRKLHEDFATDPLAHGWRVFGNTNLFGWNPTNQDLEVTWDSSQTNSFFQLPLGTILGRADDFSFSLDLRLDDIQPGVNPDKPSTFELAFGLQNSAEAQETNFFRAGSKGCADLVEFDFFPDTGYGPTVWPAIWATNSSANYNGGSDYTIVDLPVGVEMHIALAYTAADQTLRTSITTNGVAIGSFNPVPLSSSFTDFRVGTFAIASYSDAGQADPYAGSLLAHGAIDNVVVTLPPAPVQDLRADMINGTGQVQFLSRSGWLYGLERTADFLTWTTVSSGAPGTGANLILQDTTAPAARAFYRVRAERP
jgi:hypothetical protein